MSPGQLGLEFGVERWVCSRGTGGVGDLKEKAEGRVFQVRGAAQAKAGQGHQRRAPRSTAGSCLAWWAEEKWPLAVSSVTCQGRAAQDGHTAASHSSERAQIEG